MLQYVIHLPRGVHEAEVSKQNFLCCFVILERRASQKHARRKRERKGGWERARAMREERWGRGVVHTGTCRRRNG